MDVISSYVSETHTSCPLGVRVLASVFCVELSAFRTLSLTESTQRPPGPAVGARRCGWGAHGPAVRPEHVSGEAPEGSLPPGGLHLGGTSGYLTAAVSGEQTIFLKGFCKTVNWGVQTASWCPRGIDSVTAGELHPREGGGAPTQGLGDHRHQAR